MSHSFRNLAAGAVCACADPGSAFGLGLVRRVGIVDDEEFAWVYLNEEDWNLGPFLYFGGKPGTPMPPLGDKVARHTKGDATGQKKERPNIREVNKGRFRKLETIDQVWEALFGIA